MANIVILEDDPEFVVLLGKSLQKAGHKAVFFLSADKALAYIEKHNVDLVITDIIVIQDGVSVSDGGISLTWKAKQIASQKGIEIPIIAISGYAGPGGPDVALSNAKQVGANAVLAKPFTPRQLNDLIDDLL